MKNLRKKFNEKVREKGNKLRKGFGNKLTKKIDLENSLGLVGAISLPIAAGHSLCEEIYKLGLVDKMYSPEITERAMGILGALPYQIAWIFPILPFSFLIGGYIGGKVGNMLNRI